MIKMVFSLCVALIAWSVSGQTFGRDSLDLVAGIRHVECNYAGFPTKVHDGNRKEHDAMKERLWREVREGRDGYDAMAELMGWFEDFHLRCAGFSDVYRTSRMPFYGDGYNPENVAAKVDGETFLIRVPSFDVDDEGMAWIRGTVEAYRQSGCKYLIIDIRGNGGGRDVAYTPLAELLYDHVGTTEGVELRASEEHEQYLRELAVEHGNDWFAGFADKIGAAADAAFVPMTRSLRVKLGRSVDEGGIAPDVRITLPQPDTLADNIDGWVLLVADDLKNNK